MLDLEKHGIGDGLRIELFLLELVIHTPEVLGVGSGDLLSLRLQYDPMEIKELCSQIPSVAVLDPLRFHMVGERLDELLVDLREIVRFQIPLIGELDELLYLFAMPFQLDRIALAGLLVAITNPLLIPVAGNQVVIDLIDSLDAAFITGLIDGVVVIMRQVDRVPLQLGVFPLVRQLDVLFVDFGQFEVQFGVFGRTSLELLGFGVPVRFFAGNRNFFLNPGKTSLVDDHFDLNQGRVVANPFCPKINRVIHNCLFISIIHKL